MQTKLTQKQLRMLIKEEVSKVEGYHEMSDEEKQELEEGVMDFLRGAKASVAGGLAGAAAKAKGVGSAIAGGARGALAGAKGGATGETQATVKGATKYDAATIAALTKAKSFATSYLKQIWDTEQKLKTVQQNAIDQIGKMTFGKAEDVKPVLANIFSNAITSPEKSQKDFKGLVDALTKAEKGDDSVLAAMALKSKGAGDVGQQAGGKTVKFGTGSREVLRGAPAPEAAPAAAPANDNAMVAEAISRAIERKLVSMNKKRRR